MATNTNKTLIRVARIGLIGTVTAALIGVVIPLIHWGKNDPPKTSVKQDYILAGVVVDQETNREISQAEISIVGRNEHYITQQNGNFRFTIKDSLEEVRIRVTKLNYNPADLVTVVPNEEITIQLNKAPLK